MPTNITTEVLKGKLENVRKVKTSTPNSMVTFMVGGTPCKCFGGVADQLLAWISTKGTPEALEVHGHFDRPTERFGREFIVERGRPIAAEQTNNASSERTASKTVAPATASGSTPVRPVEPIAARDQIGFAAGAAVGAKHLRLEKKVTFEDLEREYRRTHAK